MPGHHKSLGLLHRVKTSNKFDAPLVGTIEIDEIALFQLSQQMSIHKAHTVPAKIIGWPNSNFVQLELIPIITPTPEQKRMRAEIDAAKRALEDPELFPELPTSCPENPRPYDEIFG